MTFVEELQHALTHEPCPDTDLGGDRKPRRRDPVDACGDEVRVLTLEDSLADLVAIMQERGDVFGGEVWEEIWATRARYAYGAHMKPESPEEQVRLHLEIKCPVPELRAVWMVYRDGKPAHAKVFDRPAWNLEHVWVQWHVGVRSIGRAGITTVQALWDVGIREVHWKTLPNHRLNAYYERLPGVSRYVPSHPDADEEERHYRGGLLHGRYIHWVRRMPERPGEHCMPHPRREKREQAS